MKKYFQSMFGSKKDQRQVAKILTKEFAPSKSVSKDSFEKFKNTLVKESLTPFSNVSDAEVMDFLKKVDDWWPEFKKTFHSQISKDDPKAAHIPADMLELYNKMNATLEPLNQDIGYTLARGFLSVLKDQKSIIKDFQDGPDRGPMTLDVWFASIVVEYCVVFAAYFMDTTFDETEFRKRVKVKSNVPGDATSTILKMAGLKRVQEILGTSMGQAIGFLNHKYSEEVFKNINREY